MKLSNRLKAISEFVNKNEVVVDIGCDHAQLCSYLVLENKIQKAYACDVNEGPLKQAEATIQHYSLEKAITLQLSNGLEHLKDDVTTIVIAGMGFETIKTILEKDIDKIQNKTCIIQSNNDVEKLREWISNHNYHILKECVIYEEGHFYQIISFNTKQDNCLEKNEIKFGKAMLKDDTFYRFWKYRLSKYETILHSLNKESLRYQEILQEMIDIYIEFGNAY